MRSNIFVLSGFVSSLIFFTSFAGFLVFLPEHTFTGNCISELGAQESSVKLIANMLGFFVPGIFFFLFGIAVFYNMKKSSAMGVTGSLLLATGGSLYTLIALFPCDALCENTTTVGKWHEFFSDASLYLGSASIFFVATALVKRARSHTTKILLGSVFALAIVGTVFAFFYLHASTSIGELLQKFAIGIPFAIMGALSLYLYVERVHQDELTPPKIGYAVIGAIALIAATIAFTLVDVFSSY